MEMNSDTLYQGLIAAAMMFALAVFWKAYDQWRDARQKVWQDLADGFAKMGWDLVADFFKALARDGYEGAYGIGKGVVERLRKPDGVAEVICTAIIKALRDPDFLNNPTVKARLDPVLAEISLGFLLDDEMQAELTRLSPVLGEYGSIEWQEVASQLGANQPGRARVAFQSFITLLRNTDRLDDEFMKRAEKLLPRVVKADPVHYAKLKAIIDAIPVPAGTT
jgi:hypothetical protein